MFPGFRHRLLAILAADAASYSRWMSFDGLATLTALEVFRSEAEASDRRVVDTAADSMALVFGTVTGAARAAAAIQHCLSQAHNDSTGLRLCFRIAIYPSNVIETADGTVCDDGVKIAARLQAIAKSGGVVVSQPIQDTCAGHLGAAFERIGQQRGKIIAKRVQSVQVGEQRGRAVTLVVGCRPHAELRGQRARAPVRGGNGLFVQRLVHDDQFKLGGGHAGRAPGARRIVHQGLHRAFLEAPAPQGHLAPIQIDFGGDVLVSAALSGQQHNLGALLHTSLDAASLSQGRLSLDSSMQFDPFGSAHDDLRRGGSVPHR